MASAKIAAPHGGPGHPIRGRRAFPSQASPERPIVVIEPMAGQMRRSVRFNGSSGSCGFEARRGGVVADRNGDRRLCKAKTGNGRPCRNPASPGSQLCGRHDMDDKMSPWWWTNAPELLRAWDEESLEADARQRLELKRVFGPPRSRSSRSIRGGRKGRSGRDGRDESRPSAVYRRRGSAEESW
jgi:hypothetical protein